MLALIAAGCAGGRAGRGSSTGAAANCGSVRELGERLAGRRRHAATSPSGSRPTPAKAAPATSPTASTGCMRAPAASRAPRAPSARVVYRRLLESMHEAMAVERDGILLANARFAELCGAASPAQLVGRQLADLVHPDLRGAASPSTCAATRRANPRPRGSKSNCSRTRTAARTALEFAFTRITLRRPPGRAGRRRSRWSRAGAEPTRAAQPRRPPGKRSTRWPRACSRPTSTAASSTSTTPASS